MGVGYAFSEANIQCSFFEFQRTHWQNMKIFFLHRQGKASHPKRKKKKITWEQKSLCINKDQLE